MENTRNSTSVNILIPKDVYDRLPSLDVSTTSYPPESFMSNASYDLDAADERTLSQLPSDVESDPWHSLHRVSITDMPQTQNDDELEPDIHLPSTMFPTSVAPVLSRGPPLPPKPSNLCLSLQIRPLPALKSDKPKNSRPLPPLLYRPDESGRESQLSRTSMRPLPRRLY